MYGRNTDFVIVEAEREISTVGSLLGAALLWTENPGARRVYSTAPSGPVGQDPWQRGREVTPEELRHALRARV